MLQRSQARSPKPRAEAGTRWRVEGGKMFRQEQGREKREMRIMEETRNREHWSERNLS